jgi:pimeloyl-ACP methyl ester carboxylesterase
MPRALIDGIETVYEVHGDGDPILMFSPGGFNAHRGNWSELGVYRGLDLVDQLSQHYACITFDRRESGESGGRVERVGWDHYVRQGFGLLDHLGVGSAHLMGGCIGCSVVLAAAVAAPERVRGMVLYSPAGGARYRIAQHRRFARHLGHVEEHGLEGVVELARSTDKNFSQDARPGPWVNILRRDPEFAKAYASIPIDEYFAIVLGLVRVQFDRDSVPGVEPEDLLALRVPGLIIPGDDPSHAPSAAQFLAECLPASTMWDVPVAEQTAANAPGRILEFLDATR